MSDTPETAELLTAIYDEHGELSENNAPEKWVKFARKLERERDELRNQLDYIKKHEAERIESDSIVASCDCLIKTPEIKHHKVGCKYRLIIERDELRAEVERLKSDKARLDWLEKNGEDLMTTNGKWVVMTGRFMEANETSVRAAIDAAMKGDQ